MNNWRPKVIRNKYKSCDKKRLSRIYITYLSDVIYTERDTINHF